MYTWCKDLAKYEEGYMSVSGARSSVHGELVGIRAWPTNPGYWSSHSLILWKVRSWIGIVVNCLPYHFHGMAFIFIPQSFREIKYAVLFTKNWWQDVTRHYLKAVLGTNSFTDPGLVGGFVLVHCALQHLPPPSQVGDPFSKSGWLFLQEAFFKMVKISNTAITLYLPNPSQTKLYSILLSIYFLVFTH